MHNEFTAIIERDGEKMRFAAFHQMQYVKLLRSNET